MLRLRARVVAELTTTFASHYTDEASLAARSTSTPSGPMPGKQQARSF